MNSHREWKMLSVRLNRLVEGALMSFMERNSNSALVFRIHKVSCLLSIHLTCHQINSHRVITGVDVFTITSQKGNGIQLELTRKISLPPLNSNLPPQILMHRIRHVSGFKLAKQKCPFFMALHNRFGLVVRALV